MVTLALIGLVGGLIAGISPCILPVLPVIFMSGGTPAGTPANLTADTPERRDLTPYAVVAGLAVSFSVFTLLGTLVLQTLPVPQDVIRVAGLVVLVLLGIGMIVPRFERVLERPFSRIRVGNGGAGRRGFVLGLALGAVYVPCAGPVLAAITVAGATGSIGGETVVLTVAFAVGTSIPLLAFALAGRRVGERVKAFREHQQAVRTAAGVVVLGLAVALTFNVTDAVQRAVPDYTSRLDKAVDADSTIRKATGSEQAVGLKTCADSTSEQLQNCGKAPAITGIESWFNTPGDQPLTDASYAGKVVLVDFWAYSCINCQRAIPHVEDWYQKYADDGLVVVGVHTPEYAFEHEEKNVESGAQRLGITYPVALDGGYKTWDSFGNSSWPAEYLIDATGQVRHVAIGEGGYDGTEAMIRQLLTDADPSVQLPAVSNLPDTTPDHQQSPETYLGYTRAYGYVGPDPLTPGRQDFTFPDKIGNNQFALDGTWSVGPEDLTAGPGARLAMSFLASKVYLDVGGTGTVTVNVAGAEKVFHIKGAPNIYTLVDLDQVGEGVLVMKVSPGLKVYSFTFG